MLESSLVRFSRTSAVVMGLKEKVPELEVVGEGESEGAAAKCRFLDVLEPPFLFMMDLGAAMWRQIVETYI